VSNKSGYAKVSDNDKQIDRAVENRSERSAFTSRRRAEKNGETVFETKKGFIDGDRVEHLSIKRVTYMVRTFTASSIIGPTK
jgi:hypothetical protein